MCVRTMGRSRWCNRCASSSSSAAQTDRSSEQGPVTFPLLCPHTLSSSQGFSFAPPCSSEVTPAQMTGVSCPPSLPCWVSGTRGGAARGRGWMVQVQGPPPPPTPPAHMSLRQKALIAAAAIHLINLLCCMLLRTPCLLRSEAPGAKISYVYSVSWPLMLTTFPIVFDMIKETTSEIEKGHTNLCALTHERWFHLQPSFDMTRVQLRPSESELQSISFICCLQHFRR